MAKINTNFRSFQALKILSRLTEKVVKAPIKRRRLIYGTLLVLSISSSVFVFRVGSNSGKDLSEFTVPAERGSLPGLITASGELFAKRSVNISPEKQGILEFIYFDEGDNVKKGDVIAEMDKGDFRYRLDELKAEFETNRLAYERRNKLFIEGAISAEENDDYKNRFLTSKARLKQMEVEGNDFSVKAPFDGVITARYAEPGAYVTPTTRASSSAGATSTSIVELSQGLELSAKVPESDIGRIRLAQKAIVRIDAFPDQRLKATVKEIAPRAVKTDNVTSFEVTLSFDNPIKALRIGMTADVEFQTGSTAITTLVPTVAIVTENGKPGLLVVGPQKQPTFQPIELGISSGSRTAILKGISPGDLVFIDLPPWAKNREN